MKLNPPIEITRPIPPQTTCPELRALRVKRDEWIISAVVQGFTAPQIAAALNMQSHQTVSAIISRWRCRHGKLATSDTASGNTRQPSDPTPLAGKHVVAFRDGHVTLTEQALGYSLRLQDCRGTAATRLLNAGLSLAEIASHMGWSVRYASSVIEHYARVSPDETDGILVKLAMIKGRPS